jgi:hypothetical protein
MAKQTCCVKRDLRIGPNRPTVSKETYKYGKTDLLCQKRPTDKANQTYYVKRDLQIRQIRPTVSKEIYVKGKLDLLALPYLTMPPVLLPQNDFKILAKGQGIS